MIKKIIDYIIEAIKETIALSWTLAGMLIGYFTLSGSAKSITGLGIVIALTIWLATIKLRK